MYIYIHLIQTTNKVQCIIYLSVIHETILLFAVFNVLNILFCKTEVYGIGLTSMT